MKASAKIKPILNVNKLGFKYSNKSPSILTDVNFAIYPNQHLTILGHNGSGKTTLAKIIAGLEHTYTGKVELDHQIKSSQKTQKVGLIFQNPESQFVGLTVENDLAFGLENLRFPPEAMLTKVKAITKQFNLEAIFNEEANNLSDGQKQKVAIASVLIQEPKIIIFDEPTSMVDPKSENEIDHIIAKIKRQKITVIEITHNIERLLIADQVLLLEHGKVKYFGSAKQLLTEKIALLKECVGLKLPFFYRLLQSLEKKGIKFKTTLNEKIIIEEICQKLSKSPI